eukprot:1166431-Amphidinium_carterae.1
MCVLYIELDYSTSSVQLTLLALVQSFLLVPCQGSQPPGCVSHLPCPGRIAPSRQQSYRRNDEQDC